MTTKEELIKPVVTSIRSNGLVQPKVATEEALEVLNKKPIPTVWGQAYGLPIYDRLPGIEQAYKIEAGPDSAFVYIEPNFPKREGPGSIQPLRAADNGSIFIMENGTITWSYGQVDVSQLAVDVSLLNNGLGLADGQYKAGYLMDYAVPDVPARAFVRQENELLSDAYVAYAAGSDLLYHEDFLALSEDVTEAWWSRDETKSGKYPVGSWYVLDFKEPTWPERIEFIAQPGEEATATLSVYYSDDAIIWYKQNQVDPVNGSWTVQNSSTTGEKWRYWRFFWWDGLVSVGNILYTGEALYEDARKNAPVSGATPFIDDLFEEIDQVHLLVATFEVANGQVASIVDQRRFIQRKYEPVAQWLTSFEDLMLRCYFTDIEQYASLYMAPPSADYHFYDELDTNACSGEGYITVGKIPQSPLILFPDIVELVYTTEVNKDILYEPGTNVFDGYGPKKVATDPEEPSFDIGTDGIVRIAGPGLITPQQVINLKAPILEGDLATKAWTDDTFNFDYDYDNGLY